MSKRYQKEEKLFAEFPQISKDEWTDQVVKDLKGRDIEKLNWNTYEDLTIKPFYNKEDLISIDNLLNSIPGEFPFVRGSNPKTNDWKINQEISSNNIKDANKLAINAIAGGTDCLTFNCTVSANGYIGVPIQDKDDILNLLVGI
ncbi:MAG: methylmalonyl-CoA mutase, partial [Nitrosopumilaceae archaeon]|nr:methylmalonyl-CoA mutase [Nitrosopumilaceae archaeon]